MLCCCDRRGRCWSLFSYFIFYFAMLILLHLQMCAHDLYTRVLATICWSDEGFCDFSPRSSFWISFSFYFSYSPAIFLFHSFFFLSFQPQSNRTREHTLTRSKGGLYIKPEDRVKCLGLELMCATQIGCAPRVCLFVFVHFFFKICEHDIIRRQQKKSQQHRPYVRKTDRIATENGKDKSKLSVFVSVENAFVVAINLSRLGGKLMDFATQPNG